MKQIHFRLLLLIVGTIVLTMLTFAFIEKTLSQQTTNPIWGWIGLALGLGVIGWVAIHYLAHWCIAPAFQQFFVLSTKESPDTEPKIIPELPELSHLHNHLRYMASHLRETEQELAEKHLELEQAQKIKAQFVQNMSAELWIPLNSILGICETLMIQPLSEAQKQLVEITYFSGHDLKQMITNLQIFAELDSGKIQNKTQWIDLKPLVEELIQEVLETVDQTLFQLEWEWEAVLPEKIYFNSQHLRLMLFNLMRTTIKITKGGALKLQLGQEKGDMLRFTMIDSGNNMAQPLVDQLFERFSHVLKNNTSADLGVSLAITKELAEFQDGQAESEIDAHTGRSFWFQIPLTATIDMAKGVQAEALLSFEDIESEDVLLEGMLKPSKNSES